MTKLVDFLENPFIMPDANALEANPIVDADALQEALLVDVHFDLHGSSVGLLLSLQTSLDFREAQLGVLILRGVERFSWDAVPRTTKRTARNVIGSVVSRSTSSWDLELVFYPDATLTASCLQIDFVAGRLLHPDDLTVDTPDWDLPRVWNLELRSFTAASTSQL